MIVRIFAVWTVIVLLTACPVVAQQGQRGLSDSQLGSGLQEALRVGTQNAVQLTGRLDGYFRHQAIKILMPKQLQLVEQGLRAVGLGSQVDEFVLSMNRAAERAAPRAGQIFLDAISPLTFDDVRQIMTGGDTAATQYLKTKTSDKLVVAFRPVVDQAMHEVGVTRQYTAQETINAIGFRTRVLPFDKTPGVKRILFLGDSHTEGYTAHDAETYPVLVQQQLAATLPVEEVSLGVGGFSTDQELLAYGYYGRRYHPDVVVLQFSANDVPFNGLDHYWRGSKPRFVRSGEILLLTGVLVPNRRDTGLFGPTLLHHSSLVVWLETLLRQFAIQRRVTHEVDWQEAWHITALLLRD